LRELVQEGSRRPGLPIARISAGGSPSAATPSVGKSERFRHCGGSPRLLDSVPRRLFSLIAAAVRLQPIHFVVVEHFHHPFSELRLSACVPKRFFPIPFRGNSAAGSLNLSTGQPATQPMRQHAAHCTLFFLRLFCPQRHQCFFPVESGAMVGGLEIPFGASAGANGILPLPNALLPVFSESAGSHDPVRGLHPFTFPQLKRVVRGRLSAPACRAFVVRIHYQARTFRSGRAGNSRHCRRSPCTVTSMVYLRVSTRSNSP